MDKLFNIKKRSLVAILITIVVIAIFNKYWLVFKPISVHLDVRGNEICNIKVALNKKDNSEFKRIKSAETEINLNKESELNFFVKKIKYPKRIKIIIADVEKDKIITIENVKIEDKVLDLDKFEVIGAKSTIDENKLILKPKDTTIYLIYPFTLKAKNAIYFDFMLFVILAVLTFLFAYKLSNYIAEFKTVKGKSRVDILFLTIFFIFLFIPMSNINSDDISKNENRTLAMWQPLITVDKQINYNFGNNFNSWFNDRFHFRDRFINCYYYILSIFTKDYYENNTIIYNKKADFAYNKTFNAVDRFLKKDSFTEDELKTIHDSLEKLKKYCDENNVKLYIALSNDKETIYPEFYPTYYHRNEKNKSRLEQVYETIKQIKGLNIILQKENILKAKEEKLVFLPYDTHMTGYGSYIEYKTIMSNIKNDFKNAKIVDLSDVEFTKSQIRCDSTPPKKYLNKDFEFSEDIIIKNANTKEVLNIKNENKSFFYTKYINNSANNNLKAVIIGDSFHTHYINLLGESFYSLTSLFVGNGYDFTLDDISKRRIFNEVPNILIIETTERFLQRFLKMDAFNDIFDERYRK